VKVGKIYSILNDLSPFELQEEWDNSGLLVGSYNDEVKRIYLSLDLDLELVEKIESNSLVITHHPLIFKGLKQLDFTKYPANIIQKMIKKDLTLICMHTNFDKTHLNRYVVRDILGYDVISCEDYLCYFEVNENFDDFSKKVQDRLNLLHLKTVKCAEFVKKVAITTGAGSQMMAKIQADCFLTGDLKYHEAFEAKQNGLSLIDIGHFESEVFFAECLSKDLKNLSIKAIIANSKNPFDDKGIMNE
jgi:dinuclear metal center YbgI/SA1388 family protein